MKYPGQRINPQLALALELLRGYACFYHGGTFFEEYAGQKSKIIESYYREYIRQEGLSEVI
jgi:hypothetical protein